MAVPGGTIWTIGHSTRSISEFITLLHYYQLEALVDVRRFPGSRRHPQFGRDQLKASLTAAGINYHSLEELGGRRRSAPDSPNTSWRNPSFRGYADYMSSKEFALGMEKLCSIAEEFRTVIMCAELLWWRCHRSMIADALMVRGITVIHIQDTAHALEHPFTQPARLYKGHLSYRANQGLLLNKRALTQESRPHH